jgi:hypothetical protein
MPFQMAPLDPPEKPAPDPHRELKTRILSCALTEFAMRGPARSPRAKSRRRSPEGNLAFCRSWVSKWVKALAGTPRFPVPTNARSAKRTERQAAAMTAAVLSFDPKITGARLAGQLFVKLFTGEASVDQITTELAAGRAQLGDAADDMHKYFAMLASRVGPDSPSITPCDESLFGFLNGSRGEVLLTQIAEPVLRARVQEAAKLIDPEAIESWLDQHWSQEALIRRRRDQFAELGDRMPHFPGRVEGAMQPENHDFAAANQALQAFIEAGDPALRNAAFRREWATTLVWLAEVATNPDRVWRGRGYEQGFDHGLLPRSWLWEGIQNDSDKRSRFNGLLVSALDVLAGLRPEQPRAVAAMAAADAPAKSVKTALVDEAASNGEGRQAAAPSEAPPPAATPAAPRRADALQEDASGQLLARLLDRDRPARTSLQLTRVNGAGGRTVVATVRGKTCAHLVNLVLAQPDQDHTWRDLLVTGNGAGHWVLSSADSLRRAGSRVEGQLPPSIKGHWQQSMTGVRWHS